jgi:hypothetical protein
MKCRACPETICPDPDAHVRSVADWDGIVFGHNVAVAGALTRAEARGLERGVSIYRSVRGPDKPYAVRCECGALLSYFHYEACPLRR